MYPSSVLAHTIISHWFTVVSDMYIHTQNSSRNGSTMSSHHCLIRAQCLLALASWVARALGMVETTTGKSCDFVEVCRSLRQILLVVKLPVIQCTHLQVMGKMTVINFNTIYWPSILPKKKRKHVMTCRVLRGWQPWWRLSQKMNSWSMRSLMTLIMIVVVKRQLWQGSRLVHVPRNRFRPAVHHWNPLIGASCRQDDN